MPPVRKLRNLRNLLALYAAAIPLPSVRDSADDGLGAGRHEYTFDHDLLGRSLTAVAVESVHLGDEQRHQLARQAKVDGPAPGGLLDVKRPLARGHRSHVRDDHLARNHRLDLVPRTDAVEERQGEVCGRVVEGLLGIGVDGVDDLLKERLGNDLLRRPERGEERRVEILQFPQLVVSRRVV